MGQYRFLVGFVGFMVNFLLTFGVNRLTRAAGGGIRCMVAGLFCGLHTFACVTARFQFLSDCHWKLIVLLICAAIAFGFEKCVLTRWLLFVLLRFSLDSLATDGIVPMLVLGASILLLCSMDRPGNGNFAVITIEAGGKRASVRALLDTGNTLKDPISGLDVIVVDADIAREIFGFDQNALCHPLETFQQRHIPGLRLIPYSSVGQPSGLLLGLRMENLKINGKKAEKILAFAPHKIGQGNGFQALAGGNV